MAAPDDGDTERAGESVDGAVLSGAGAVAADYMLAPATRLLWRSPSSVHLELGSRGVLVEGLPVPVIQQVASRSRGAAATSGAHENSPATVLDADARHALHTLAEAGYLWKRPPGAPSAAGDSADGRDGGDERMHIPRPALGPEFASLTARHGTAAARVLAARRASTVQLFGAGRLTAHLGAVLAASGVGRIHCAVSGTTLLHHATPGGARPADEGQLASRTAEAAVRAAAPDVNTLVIGPDERPDLTILALDGPLDDDHRRGLHARDAPYLSVSLGVDHGIVGPLVLPGLTSCVRCADLHRFDRDPAWPALAAQLSIPRRYGPASDVATATLVCGLAALQSLAFLDGDEPAVIDATIESRSPDWRLRRRSWPPHPDCDCAHTMHATGANG